MKLHFVYQMFYSSLADRTTVNNRNTVNKDVRNDRSLKIRSVAFLVILGYRRSLFRCSKSTRSFFRLLMVIRVAFSVAFLVIHSRILVQNNLRKQPKFGYSRFLRLLFRLLDPPVMILGFCSRFSLSYTAREVLVNLVKCLAEPKFENWSFSKYMFSKLCLTT